MRRAQKRTTEMDQREKLSDFEETLRVAIGGMLLDVMTCMPVQIISWDPVTNTCSAQPLLQSRVQAQDGTYSWVNQSPIIQCPVVFAGGGGWTATFPIHPGDEALAIFSNRSIDEWWLAGGIQKRNDLRSHSVSDGFILVGPRSKPKVLENINPDAMEIRSDDGLTKISLTTGTVAIDGPVAINATSTTKITLTAPIVNVIGVLQVNGVPVAVP